MKLNNQINPVLLNKFRMHIICILNFLQLPKTSYKYVDLLAETKTDILLVEDLPDEFSLFLSDKAFCGYKLVNGKRVVLLNQLHPSLNVLFYHFNKQWQYYTGDFCNPIPVKKEFDKSVYNPTLAYYAVKNKKLLWVKENLELRKDYLQSLIAFIDSVLVIE